MRLALFGGLRPFAAAFAAGLGILSLASPAMAQSGDCFAIPTTGEKTTLTALSDVWFGDGSYRFAIMLASNKRAGQNGIGFIGDPDALASKSKVCIPHIAEAEQLRRRYDRYVEAVEDMAVAQPWEEVDTLTPLPQTGTYRVATWIRSDQVSRYPKTPSTSFDYAMGGDTWVTLEPNLQNFCKAYTKDVSSDPAALTLRLEQRLGLPPVSAKTHFVIFEIDAAAPNSGQKIFRPCGDTATNTNTCKAGITTDNLFLYRQYYQAFGTTKPVQYPWTSLGYTFDWAPNPDVLGKQDSFVRVGESEYVVPEKTMTKFVGITPTAQYCAP